MGCESHEVKTSGIHERTVIAEPAMPAGEPGGAAERGQQPAITETSSFSGFVRANAPWEMGFAQPQRKQPTSAKLFCWGKVFF